MHACSHKKSGQRLKSVEFREFPSGLVVRIWHFHCRGLGSVPSRGTKIPASMAKEKKERKARVLHQIRVIRSKESQAERHGHLRVPTAFVFLLVVIVVVQPLSCVRLSMTPWTAARQASLSFTISQSLLKLMSIESVMPPNHLILCRPLLPLPSVFLGLFQ